MPKVLTNQHIFRLLSENKNVHWTKWSQ